MSQQAIIKWYEEQARAAGKSSDYFKKRINQYSFLRLAVLALIIFAVYKSVEAEQVFLTELAVLGGMLAFAWLVSKQGKFEKEMAFYKALADVNKNELECILNQRNKYPDGTSFVDESHFYTSDLDIFGRGSLFALLNRCATAAGNNKLSGWLKAAAKTEEIEARQNAVIELAHKPEWLQHFKASLWFSLLDADSDVPKILLYLKEPFSNLSPLIVKYISLAPWLVLSCAVAGIFFPYFFIPAAVAGIVNVAIVFSHSMNVNKADYYLGKAGKTLYNYSEAFKLIEKEEWTSPYLKSLSVKNIAGKGSLFHESLKKLSSLSSKLEYRLNIFVGPVLNFVFAWDVRQLIAIERWKQENALSVELAFNDLSTLEALVSLVSVHVNYPEWCFPQISDADGYSYSADQLGHPLITKGRVLNDFQLDNTFKVDIITGSNMAGKSTFLRTLGINAVLALAGAPVCAKKLVISNVLIFTYMRIKDSLNESTSTFKAELNRLKFLLDTLSGNEKVYFMIDEMLRGTNSVDKYLGSKAIIEKLIALNAVGLVATHDLQIAKLEDKYPHYVRNFYFDIRIEHHEMLFDYKLKHGACQTFNAAILLKGLGLDISHN